MHHIVDVNTILMHHIVDVDTILMHHIVERFYTDTAIFWKIPKNNSLYFLL